MVNKDNVDNLTAVADLKYGFCGLSPLEYGFCGLAPSTIPERSQSPLPAGQAALQNYLHVCFRHG